MKILYVVGRGSKHDNIELRWSLRSIAKYASNVTGVVVAGYPPDWLSDEVVKIHVPDDPKAGYKHVNIMNAILAAIDAKAVEGEFLYSSDDHFLCGPCDFDRYPVLVSHKADLDKTDKDMDGAERSRRNNLYTRSMLRTGELLRRAGLPTVDWSQHAFTYMNTEDAPAVRQLLDTFGDQADPSGLGFEPTCVFMAIRSMRGPVKFVRRSQDLKWTESLDFPDPGMPPVFSIADSMFCNPEFVDYMETEFSEPCRYERTEPDGGLSRPSWWGFAEAARLAEQKAVLSPGEFKGYLLGLVYEQLREDAGHPRTLYLLSRYFLESGGIPSEAADALSFAAGNCGFAGA